MDKFIKTSNETSVLDIPEVGGKNASLGEMATTLASKGIRIPDGFSVTVSAFKHFINYNKLDIKLQEVINTLDKQEFTNLAQTGADSRKLIMSGAMPADLQAAIINAYKELFRGIKLPVAVRSSATAEDLPQASFAGQHESYLNILGEGTAGFNQNMEALKHNFLFKRYFKNLEKSRKDTIRPNKSSVER